MNRPKSALTKFFLLLLLAGSQLLASPSAHADDVIRTATLDLGTFNTETQAVEAMRELCLIASIEENAEHMGAIVKTAGGDYLVTHGKASPGQTQVAFAISRPAEAEIVALWHTHGAPGRRTERFSIQDLDTVRQTGLPFYLITPRGEIRVVVSKAGERAFTNRSSIDSSRLTRIRGFRGLTLYGFEEGIGDA